MHECEPKKEVKRFKGVGYDVGEKQSPWDPLIVMSPFQFFMKEFTNTRDGGEWVEVNREGFEVWKKMSEKRQPYVNDAERIDQAYQTALLEESNDRLKVDDEADSGSTVGNNGKFVEFYKDSDNESSDFLGESWANSVHQ